MTENHQVIHLNSRRRSKSPHFKTQNGSMRNSATTSQINFNARLVDIPSPIFGLNQFNDSHRYSNGRIQSIRSPSNRSAINTKRSNNNQPILHNSQLLKSQHSHSVRIDTLESQENRSFLRKQFENHPSMAGYQISQQLSKSQNLRQFPAHSLNTPQKMQKKGTPRQSSKSPQKLNLTKNIVHVNDINSLRKSQNNSQVLANISNQQSHMKGSFGRQKYVQMNVKNSQFPTPASTTLGNSRSNIILAPSNQRARLQMSNSSQGFFKNTQIGLESVNNRTLQPMYSNQSTLRNSQGFRVSVSPCNRYQHPHQLVRDMTPQRNALHMNPKSNLTINSPQNIVRKVTSSPMFKDTNEKSGENSTIMACGKTPDNGQYIVSSVSERERQLLRKVKVLQKRIGELHNEKQNAVLKLKQENHRISSQNQQLKDQIDKIQSQLQRLQYALNKSRHQQNVQTNGCDFSRQLHERQFSTDQVQEKISQLDPQQSQFDIANVNGSNGQRLVKHLRENPSVVEDYESKIQQLIITLQTQKAINDDLNEQIKQLKLFSFSNFSETNIQKEAGRIIHHLGGTRNNCSNSGQGGNTKRELDSLKRTVIEDSKSIQMNNRMIIEQYEMQVSNLKIRIAQLENFRAKRKSELQNSRYIRNSGTSYSNLQSSRDEMQISRSPSQFNPRNTKQIYPATDGYPEDDYKQIQQLNQVIDKITTLEQRNNQLEALATNLTIERDHLIQKNQALEGIIRELQNQQQSTRKALNETVFRNAQTIRLLSQQKDEYSITLKNYGEELNQLRYLCQKYSQKGLSLSSSGVQTETGPKLNNNSYGGNSCRKCEDLMKTVSKLNSHLNSRR